MTTIRLMIYVMLFTVILGIGATWLALESSDDSSTQEEKAETPEAP